MQTPPEPSDDELTDAILGTAIDIHRKLGSDQSESTYRDALVVGLEGRGLETAKEFSFEIVYQGVDVGTGNLDLFVEGEVALELKALKRTTEEHFRQLGRNVDASGATRGLLLNFGRPTLDIRRYIASPSSDD